MQPASLVPVLLGQHGRGRRPARAVTTAAGGATYPERELEPGHQVWLPEHVERWARTLLRRYGVVFRRVLAEEAGAPPWREPAPANLSTVSDPP